MKREIRVALTGALGRMGVVMREHFAAVADITVVLAVSHRCGGRPEAVVPALGNIPLAGGFPVRLDRSVDVLLDFSVPDASLEYARFAAANGIPMVIGTTGFSPAQVDELAAILVDVPCLVSPNMSLMMNVVFRMVANATAVLEDYGVDVEIAEAHHRGKRNAPSDTALKLAQLVADKRRWPFPDCVRHDRWGTSGERPEQEIGIQCRRGGDIPSEHNVIFAGTGERLEIAHRTHSLDCYARGAEKALRWIVNQPPGVYDMLDMLGLPEVMY